MKKNIYQLLSARAFSEFASSMYAIILPLLALDMSGSLKNVGIFYGIIKIPSVLLLPFLGVFVEKFSRKRLILLCNALLFCLFAVQLFLSTFGMSIMILTLMGIFINLIASIHDISSRVIFSEIVPTQQLEKYNGIKSVVDNSAVFIAPMLGTFLYGIFGLQVVLILILCLYGIAATGIYFLPYQPKLTTDKKSWHVFAEMKEGLQFVKTKKSILAFFLLATTLNFFVASTEEIINPGILITKYAIPKKFFGFSSTFNIIGVLLAGIFIARNRKINYQQQLSKLFIINSSVMILIGATSLILKGENPTLYYGIFLGLQILLGFFTMLINIPLTSYFQANVPVEFQGRFFSFFAFAANLSIPFGISYSGFLSQTFGADTTYIFNNLCVIAIVIWTYKSFHILGGKKAKNQ